MPFEEENFFRTIANEAQLLTPAQVEECIEIQRQTQGSSNLFVIMIEKGYINHKNMAAILKKAPPEMQKDAGKEGSEKKFGELCIEKGFASPNQVAECLALQDRLKHEGKHFRIGQILIEKKYVAIRQAQLILEIQGKKILRCPPCETKYNIRHYKAEKKYLCPKCGGDLVSSAPGAAVNVERTFMSRDSVDVDDEALALLHKKIGDYEIVELLGEGGMADVYKVVNRFRKQPRALKVMKAQAGFDRFNREFESAHVLRHPNIIRVYDTGKVEGRPYFFMEYMDGGTLARRIEKMGVIPLKEALMILKQIAMGLKYAHENNIIHRDIKPSNILLTQENQEILAKIADFGIARTPSDNQITVTGQLVGTFKYMAPEHIKGHNIDGRADIFSLGILTYEMLAGREPFTVDAPVGYLFVNIKETPPAIHQLNPDLPKNISLMVNQMMAKDPKNRYDASALLRDLDRIIQGLKDGTRIEEADDKTSVFYNKGTFTTLKGLWSRIFTHEETSQPENAETTPTPTPAGAEDTSTFLNMSETEEVGKEATAEKQYEFALDLLHKGNKDGAEKHLKALIEIFPATPWAMRAKKQLTKMQPTMVLAAPKEASAPKEKDAVGLSTAKKKRLP